MLTFPPGAKVFLSVTPIDFRKQIKGLKKWIQYELKENPYSRCYFLFLSKNRKAIKVLHFDGQGMCLYWKVLSTGKFQKYCKLYDAANGAIPINSTEGQVILMNGNASQLQIPPNWQELEEVR